MHYIFAVIVTTLITTKANLYLQTEYKYCYDVVLHYVLHYLNKETEPKPSESTTYTS
jgi:hypothetical protein